MQQTAAARFHEYDQSPSIFAAVTLGRLRLFLIVMLGFCMPLSRVIRANGKLVNFALADLLLPLAILFLAWMALRGGIRIPVAPVFCAMLASLLASTFVNLDATLTVHGPVSIVVEFTKELSLWLYFYAVVNLVGRKSDLLLLLKSWVISSTLVALSGVFGSLAFQVAGIETPFSLMFRAQGTFEDSNLFATHLALSLFLTLVYRQLAERRTWWTMVAVLCQVAGVFFSASRGAMLALMVGGSLVWLLFSSARAKVLAAVLVVVACSLLSSIPGIDEYLARNPITERLGTATVDLNNPEAQQRRQLWEDAVREFRHSPVLGVGRGNYGTLSGRIPGIGYAHNTYLSLLAETGLAGFLCYASLAGFFLFALVRDLLTGTFDRWKMAGAFLLVGLLVTLLSGVTISLENYRGLWMLLAMIECFRRLYRPGEAGI